MIALTTPPQCVTLSTLPDMGHNWLRGFTTLEEAERLAADTGQVCYYFYPANKTYYVPVNPKVAERVL